MINSMYKLPQNRSIDALRITEYYLFGVFLVLIIQVVWKNLFK